MLEPLVDSFVMEFEQLVEFLPRLLLALVAALVIYIAGRIVAKVVVRILKRTDMPTTYHEFFRKMVSGIGIFLSIIIFLNLIGYSALAASLVAGGGLTAVMLGFAFKDIGENFLAGFFLAFSRPFNTDDVIETENITGRVKSIQLRQTHIRTIDGSDVFVPSSQLFTKPLRNYTLDGLRRGSFTVGIDYHDDSEKALEVILKAISESKGVLKRPAPSTSIKGFDPSFVEIQAFFWISSKDQELNLGVVRTRAMEKARRALIENGFTFSSNMTTAIDMRPVDVNINKPDNQSPGS
ncbi:mechanosensitive ion channel family protein [Rhodohalobacter sp.]|uniref:mechanosensitive ion channel family protein n=1 Tax=Rhodohalobacter sp. TaxID=1974210 RepID=UPI002ACEC692|nr:mechanosensitive ion channel family protein [Rhodohalobacter sp.]MDZ7755580.1 mechanosensitive ion channel family protein [Rhodohalobacter sp.]